jgi:hypothetical protein
MPRPLLDATSESQARISAVVGSRGVLLHPVKVISAQGTTEAIPRIEIRILRLYGNWITRYRVILRNYCARAFTYQGQ